MAFYGLTVNLGIWDESRSQDTSFTNAGVNSSAGEFVTLPLFSSLIVIPIVILSATSDRVLN